MYVCVLYEHEAFLYIDRISHLICSPPVVQFQPVIPAQIFKTYEIKWKRKKTHQSKDDEIKDKSEKNVGKRINMKIRRQYSRI